MLKRVLQALFLLCAGLAAGSSASTDGTWTLFTEANDIGDIALHGNYIWCNTTGGIVRWDRRDSTYVKFTYRDGLDPHEGYGIYVSPDGVVWAGRGYNPYKYDGSSWDPYPQGYPTSPILSRSDGSTWFGGPTGFLIRYDGSKWTWIFPENPNAAPFGVNCMAEDREGVLWFGCTIHESSLSEGAFFRNGVMSLSGSEYTHYTEDDGLLSNHVYGILADADNVKWFGTRKGISRFDGVSWVNYPIQPDTSAVLWSPLVRSRDGAFWMLGSGGLYRFDGKNWDVFPTPEESSERITLGYYQNLAIDGDDVLWFGNSRGLFRFDGKTWGRWLESGGPVSNSCFQIFVDSRNRKWLLHQGALTMFDGAQWKDLSANCDFGMQEYGILEDRDGVLWFTNQRYPVCSYDNGQWKTYSLHANSIATDRDDVKWMLASDGAMYRFNGSDWHKEFMAPADSKQFLAIDRDNRKWFLGRGILGSSDGTTTRTYTEADGLIKGGYISAFFIDRADVKWCICNRHLMSLDGEHWIDRMGEIPGATRATCLLTDSHNVKWVYTDAGLWTYDGNVWKEPVPKEFLPGEVSGVVEAPDGTIWLSAGNTLFHWNGKKYVTHACEPDFGMGLMAIDREGTLWGTGSKQGIVSYREDFPDLVESISDRPAPFVLYQNRPNPFNPYTIIRFSLSTASKVELSVYSITGQKIRNLIAGYQSAGVHAVVWDGKDNTGNAVSSGVYLARLASGGQTGVGKMLLVR